VVWPYLVYLPVEMCSYFVGVIKGR